MKYKLTEQQNRNRNNLRMMNHFIRKDPRRFRGGIFIIDDKMSLEMLDYEEVKEYKVVIENKPNNFPWKWLVK